MISFSRYYFFVIFLFFVSGPVYSIELPDFTELAEEYSPSVVNILSEKEFKEEDDEDESREAHLSFLMIRLEIFLKGGLIEKIDGLKGQVVQVL